MDGMVWWAEAGIDVESAGARRVVRADSEIDSGVAVEAVAPTYRRTAGAWLARVRDRSSSRGRAR